MNKLNAKQLRSAPKPTKKQLEKIRRNPIYLILDRIIDTYNIGSLFRLADAIGAQKMYLCGEMEYPPNSRIHKAAVGTQKWVPWEKAASTTKAVKKLKKQEVQIVAIEQSPKSIHYAQITAHLRPPVALIVGNESEGIEQDVLNEVDLIVELPMHGINKSFNTWGSAAVISYKILESVAKSE